MVREAVIKKLLVCEILGFCAVIVLLWVNELVDLPHVLFRTGRTPVNWAECLFESLVVAFLAFVVLIWSQVLLARVRYLEGFLPVCRGCSRIRVGDEWMSLESYTQQYWQEAVSYGLCPDCAEKMRDIEQSLQAESKTESK
ncbi:MAG: hypothetical protein ACYTF6_03685 [Planctomycetota bacterium]|jgi:hypothetical protein